MIGTNLLNRYLIESELGRGGLGVVFRAWDSLLNRAVAIKFLTDSQLGSQGRSRLLHEAQTAAGLNHPNIISIFDAGQIGDTYFIVMELLQGASLYEYHPQSIRETLGIAVQICQALEHAHAHGVIHRDLKPENVIIGPNGQAKLTDFGLARSIASRISVEGAIIGTVYYIPPEQALGKEIDPRADLYSLGVILYEQIAGKLPYEADNPLAVISQHLYAPLVPPSSYNPNIPASLDSLVVKLMGKHPGDRPGSAGETRRLIESILVELDSGLPVINESTNLTVSSPLDRLVRGRLVGREREIEEAKQIWRHSITGGAEHVLFVSGESGVGKSPFIREIIAMAEVSGGRAVIGVCYSEGGAPYAPIAQIVREVLPAAIPELMLADLIKLAPDLQVRYPHLPPNPALDPQAEQQRLFESITALCASLTADKPLLLVVEDAQWADGGTLALLKHLARRCRNSHPELPILILLTYRDVELGGGHPLNEILFDLSRERLAGRIKLSRFNKEQTRQLLAVMFRQEIEPTFLEAIYQETEGNLFYVEEVCRTLIENGIIYHSEGQWHQPSNMDDILIPQSIRMAIQSRINKLPAESQEALLLAALIGREFDFAALLAASEMDEERLIAALEWAERAQLIEETKRIGREAFVFSHGLTMATLRESMTGIRRRRLHRRIAAAIEAINPDDFEALANHYFEAGDEQKACLNFLKAGDRALSIYANQEAIRFYSEALELAEPGSLQRFRILASRAQIYSLIGIRSAQKDDVQMMLELADELTDPSLRCEALLAKADYEIAGNSLDALPFAEQAAVLARQLKEPVKEGQALLAISQVHRYSGNHQLSRTYIDEAVKLFRDNGRLDLAAAGLHTLSLILQAMGLKALALASAEEALQLSRQAGDRRQEAISLRRLAIIYEEDLKPEQALPLAEAALALHRQLGDRTQECHALNLVGLVLNLLGRHAEMGEYLHHGLELAWETQSGEAIQYISSNLYSLYYYRLGAYEVGLSFIDEQIERLRRANLHVPADFLIIDRAEVLTGLGQYQEALQNLEYLGSVAEDIVSPVLQSRLHSMKALALAGLGDLAGAERVMEQAGRDLAQNEASHEIAFLWKIHAYIHWLHHSPEYLQSAYILIQKSIADPSYSNLSKISDYGTALIILALIELDLGKMGESLLHSTQAIELLEETPLIPIPETWFMVHIRTLYANGRREEGDRYLLLAYQRIDQVLTQIKNPIYRLSYTTDVRAVREILSEWEARQNTRSKVTTPEVTETKEYTL